jgi:cytochrome c-type biogenesis protein CcmH/NrfG
MDSTTRFPLKTTRSSRRRCIRVSTTCALMIAAAMTMVSSVRAQEPAALAASALAVCAQADRLTGEVRWKRLSEGLALAENAVKDDPYSAQAHFAVFCNLGKQSREMSVFHQALVVSRLRAELDAAMALAPDEPDILTAKGAFLIELPGFLGGDAQQGRALLRRALAMDPNNRTAQRYLTRADTEY